METTAHTPSPSPSPTRTPSAGRPLKLAVVVASNREGRFAPVVADWFTSRARRHTGFTVDVIDPARTELPTALTGDPSPTHRELLAEVGARLAAADAFAVVTPEYNHSYPAPLKNLVDWYHAEWHAKPVAFVSYGGVSGGLRAVEHLRQVFAELHAVTVRDTVSFHQAWGLFGDDGEPLDPAGPDGAAKKMLDQLGWWGRALRTARAEHPYAG
ncbi:NADPH-dependent FMN reductase [Streptomyces fradiae]|uniref:NADPH-dependent FMN reductase n=1 Tax=Streptomyces fradiae TaxID=1906 RepID=UPI0036FA7A40